jgi:hypothetical protein
MKAGHSMRPIMLEILSLFLCVLFWRAATNAFDELNNQVGWILVVLSAMNFASFLIRIV